MNVFLPGWVYPVVGGTMAALLAATVGLLTRLRGAHRLRLLGFYVAAVVALLGFLHITDWREIAAGHGGLVIAGSSGGVLEGRYLLPVVGVLGLCVGLIVNRVPARFRTTVCGLTLTGLLGLEVVALATILQVYYL